MYVKYVFNSYLRFFATFVHVFLLSLQNFENNSPFCGCAVICCLIWTDYFTYTNSVWNFLYNGYKYLMFIKCNKHWFMLQGDVCMYFIISFIGMSVHSYKLCHTLPDWMIQHIFNKINKKKNISFLNFYECTFIS